jgi:hypothetical protein
MTEAIVDDALVEVVDTDRATYLALGIFHTCANRMIHAGWADESPEMQRIARHRLAGVAAGREEAAKVADENAASSVPLMRGLGVAALVETGRYRAATEIATAIRQRGE